MQTSHPERSLRRDLENAPGFSTWALLLAVLGSVAGAIITSAVGTGQWGTLAGAALGPVISTTFSTQRTGESGGVRKAIIIILSVGALFITVTGFTFADHVAGKSILPGPNQRSSTFFGPASQPNTPSVTSSTGPTGNGPAIRVQPCGPLDCGTAAVGADAPCPQPVTITSAGNSVLRVTSVEVTGSDKRTSSPARIASGHPSTSTRPATCRSASSQRPQARDRRLWSSTRTFPCLTGALCSRSPAWAAVHLLPIIACKGMCGVKPSLVTTCASRQKPARKLPKTMALPPAAAAQPVAHMALIPACRGMCGVKPSLVTTCASRQKPARKLPKTIALPPVAAPDDPRNRRMRESEEDLHVQLGAVFPGDTGQQGGEDRGGLGPGSVVRVHVDPADPATRRPRWPAPAAT